MLPTHAMVISFRGRGNDREHGCNYCGPEQHAITTSANALMLGGGVTTRQIEYVTYRLSEPPASHHAFQFVFNTLEGSTNGEERFIMGREGRDSVGWVRGLYVRLQRVERDVRDLLAQAARAHAPVSSNLRTGYGFIALFDQQLAQLVSRTHDHSSAQVFVEGWRNKVLGVDRYHGKIELTLSALRGAFSGINGASKHAQLPRIEV